jgi:hypothetical protein
MPYGLTAQRGRMVDAALEGFCELVDASDLVRLVRLVKSPAGLEIFRSDRRLRLFVYARWLHAGVTMALPFYVLQATAALGVAADVAILLGAQTAGALLSNPLWGWWGDVRGKQSLLEGVIALTCLPPLATLAWLGLGEAAPGLVLPAPVSQPSVRPCGSRWPVPSTATSPRCCAFSRARRRPTRWRAAPCCSAASWPSHAGPAGRSPCSRSARAPA